MQRRGFLAALLALPSVLMAMVKPRKVLVPSAKPRALAFFYSLDSGPWRPVYEDELAHGTILCRLGQKISIKDNHE